MLRTGGEEWRQTLQGPQYRVVDGAVEVTFWWRDPAGGETHSPRRQVRLYITGVTDHHRNARLQSLVRLPGTGAWSWRTTLLPIWRGSYCFILSDRDDDFSPEVFSADAPDRVLLREGWRKLLPRAIADPLNPHSWQGGHGHGVPALEMSQAPAQPGWDQFNEAHPPARCLEWRSARLGNHRRVWIYTTGEAVDPQTQSLAILLDGQFWAESMPVWSPLAVLTREERPPPAVYLLTDAIDNRRRGVELFCHCDFRLVVQEELLPLIRGHAPFSGRPEWIVMVGQSSGDLAAMSAALNWPQRSGCVLSQSGSYWWPHRDGRETGFIGEQLRQDEVSVAGLCIWLEAGQREPIILCVNQALLAQLIMTQQTIFWCQVDGGYDVLCWHGGLTAGLIQPWQSLLSHP